MTNTTQHQDDQALFRPEDCEMLSVMAFGYMDSGNYQKALHLYRAMALQDARWRLGAAYCFFAMGKKKNALRILNGPEIFPQSLLPSYHLLERCCARSSTRL